MKSAIEQLVQRLSPPLNNLRQFVLPYWQQISRREQWLIITALVVLAIWLVWQGVFVSLAEQQQRAASALAASQRQLTQIESQAALIRQLRASGSVAGSVGNQPMDTVVHALARSHKLTIERVGYEGDLLSVELAPARFDYLMNWLVELAQKQRIKVHSLRLHATDTSGMVDIGEIQFERQ